VYKRRFKWFGRLKAEDGSSISYGNRTVYYRDIRGAFALGWEDGFLFPPLHQIEGESIQLTESELNVIIERLLEAIRSEGHDVQVFRRSDKASGK